VSGANLARLADVAEALAVALRTLSTYESSDEHDAEYESAEARRDTCMETLAVALMPKALRPADALAKRGAR
jgi:hypothetical protein